MQSWVPPTVPFVPPGFAVIDPGCPIASCSALRGRSWLGCGCAAPAGGSVCAGTAKGRVAAAPKTLWAPPESRAQPVATRDRGGRVSSRSTTATGGRSAALRRRGDWRDRDRGPSAGHQAHSRPLPARDPRRAPGGGRSGALLPRPILSGGPQPGGRHRHQHRARARLIESDDEDYHLWLRRTWRRHGVEVLIG
jgi:hypothetical protein